MCLLDVADNNTRLLGTLQMSTVMEFSIVVIEHEHEHE
jgi:hypothetical protein